MATLMMNDMNSTAGERLGARSYKSDFFSRARAALMVLSISPLGPLPFDVLLVIDCSVLRSNSMYRE